MTESSAENSGNRMDARLPRRDFFILPLLGIFTALALIFGTETTARHFYFGNSSDSCRIHDANIGFSTRPGCTSLMKNAESSWETNQYNDCGYRTKESCGPKPPGTTRIALVGSSMSEGWFVAYDQILAKRAALELTRTLGRPVEVQNLSREQCSPICAFHRIPEALALKPDILLLAVSPYDIEKLDPSELPDRYKPIETSQNVPGTEKTTGLVEKLKNIITHSATAFAIEHFFFQDTSIYLRSFLRHGDPADYLRQPFSPAWENRLNAFEVLLAEMSRDAHAQNVPFVLMEIPNVAQASLVSSVNVPAGVDPYAFNIRLGEISAAHGIQFISGLDGFRGVSDASKFYFVGDGHMNASGNLLMSRILVEQLTKRQEAALSGHSETPQVQRR